MGVNLKETQPCQVDVRCPRPRTVREHVPVLDGHKLLLQAWETCRRQTRTCWEGICHLEKAGCGKGGILALASE